MVAVYKDADFVTALELGDSVTIYRYVGPDWDAFCKMASTGYKPAQGMFQDKARTEHPEWFREITVADFASVWDEIAVPDESKWFKDFSTHTVSTFPSYAKKLFELQLVFQGKHHILTWLHLVTHCSCGIAFAFRREPQKL